MVKPHYLMHVVKEKKTNYYILFRENILSRFLLFNTCSSKYEAIAKYLAEHGANINKERMNGETPLFDACISGNETTVKYLVENEEDINKENDDDETTLFNACKDGNIEIIKILIEQGADVNKTNKFGNTPLNYVHCWMKHKRERYLVEHSRV